MILKWLRSFAKKIKFLRKSINTYIVLLKLVFINVFRSGETIKVQVRIWFLYSQRLENSPPLQWNSLQGQPNKMGISNCFDPTSCLMGQSLYPTDENPPT